MSSVETMLSKLSDAELGVMASEEYTVPRDIPGDTTRLKEHLRIIACQELQRRSAAHDRPADGRSLPPDTGRIVRLNRFPKMSEPTFVKRYGLTPCQRLGEECRIYSEYDPSRKVSLFQHGDNEEHRLELADIELIHAERFPTEAALNQQVADWINRVHEYEAHA